MKTVTLYNLTRRNIGNVNEHCNATTVMGKLMILCGEYYRCGSVTQFILYHVNFVLTVGGAIDLV